MHLNTTIFMQVNENGLVSFSTEISIFYNVQFPMEYPIIAPFYADIDTRGVGQVYWRASREPEDLSRAANLVRQYYQTEFQPKEIVVITWDQVGYFDNMTDKVIFLLFDFYKVEYCRQTWCNSSWPVMEKQAFQSSYILKEELNG